MQESWYEVTEGQELMQGDILEHCPKPSLAYLNEDEVDQMLDALQLAPEEASREIQRIFRFVIDVHRAIVVSQSCDLVQGKLQDVLLCPCWDLETFQQRDRQRFHRSMKEQIRRGNVPAFHMLAACSIENFVHSVQVVDFRSAFSLPFKLVQMIANRQGKRLRLKSPYREHLSQAFARFFMRVGLLADIPPFR